MKSVIVFVRGGLVQDVVAPPGVLVVVRDYDVDGSDDDSLCIDGNGDKYQESTWEHTPHEVPDSDAPAFGK